LFKTPTITITLLVNLFVCSAYSQLTGKLLNTDSVNKPNLPRFDSLVRSNYKSHIAKAADLTSFSRIADTTPASLLHPYWQLKNNALNSWQAKKQQLTNITNLHNLIPLPADLYKHPVVLHTAHTEYNRIDNDGSYVNPSARAMYGDVEVTSSWSVATIPLNLQFNNQTWNDVSNNNYSNLGIHFNREAYLQQLKKSLKDKFNPEELLNNDIHNQVEAIKQNAEGALKKELEKVNQSFGNELNDKIKELGDLKGMLTNDMTTVRGRLLNSQYVQSVADKEKLLTELQNKKNTGEAVDNNQLDSLQKEVSKLKGVNALLDKVQEQKNKWQSSGVVKKIKQLDVMNKAQLQQLASDPATTIKMAKEHLQLNGLQKLFLKINQLNIGQNTLSESPLSVQHLLNKGFNTELQDKNKSLMLGIGKISSLNSIIDRPFTGSVLSNDGSVKMVSVGLGNPSAAHSRVSVATYNQSLGTIDYLSSLSNLTSSGSFRSTVVTTISNEMPLGERGIISAELSRSATTYQQAVQSDTTLPGKTAMQRILSSDNLLNNMAFSLKYEDELADKDLLYGVHAGMTAPGYTNPGNSYLNAGGKELGFNVKKSFLKRKFQASVRNDWRAFNYGDDASKVWRSSYTIVDVRMKLRKGQSVGLRYMPNKMTRVEDGHKNTVTALQRLAADGALAQRIGRTYYRNNVTLAWQQNRYMLGSDRIANNSVTLSSFQNITLKGKLLYLNMQYDHASNNSQYVYFNSSVISEAGITYLLLKKISLSSAVTYNSVQGWYRQMGIRQTISGQLGERFNMNIYVDARRNLKLYQPLLYGLFRTDISINYLIKK
jgi:hypothetical protein